MCILGLDGKQICVAGRRKEGEGGGEGGPRGRESRIQNFIIWSLEFFFTEKYTAVLGARALEQIVWTQPAAYVSDSVYFSLGRSPS